jgi:hypothetical protein
MKKIDEYIIDCERDYQGLSYYKVGIFFVLVPIFFGCGLIRMFIF